MKRQQTIEGHKIMGKKKWQKKQRMIMRDILRPIGTDKGRIPDYIYKMVMHQHCRSSVRLIYPELISHYEWLHDVFRKKSDDNSEDKLLDFVNICVYFSRCDGISFLIGEEFGKPQCLSFVEDLKVLIELGWNSVITLIWNDVVPESVSKILQSDR